MPFSGAMISADVSHLRVRNVQPVDVEDPLLDRHFATSGSAAAKKSRMVFWNSSGSSDCGE